MLRASFSKNNNIYTVDLNTNSFKTLMNYIKSKYGEQLTFHFIKTIKIKQEETTILLRRIIC